MDTQTLHDLGWALGGGALIGAASAMLMLLRGRIAGISGITKGIISSSTDDKGWRVLFVLGLLAGGATLMAFRPSAIVPPDQPGWLVIVAGLLVGFGTSLGNGCTSGHGVCGISRASSRSIVATVTFVAMGMLSASLIHG